jgi:hypothetical protein
MPPAEASRPAPRLLSISHLTVLDADSRMDDALRILDAGARLQARAVLIICNDPDEDRLVGLHLQRSGGTPADVSAVVPERLPYAQLCDGPFQPILPASAVALSEGTRLAHAGLTGLLAKADQAGDHAPAG